MRPAICVEKLSKQYQIGTRPKLGSRNLTETLTDGLKGLWRGVTRKGAGSNGDDSTLWALKDISFEVQPGAVVGIVGRNGAGKSTLLKILSRIVEPTAGRAEVRGRMGSLLEVGTGFHPELTGRENIYLNGSLLGMSRREVTQRFDEIVAFSEVEKFLDTPVKRYSSGMYVRLAFAVAAHLELEILFVDEVLAVGDAAFQKKCLGKMERFAGEGRTVFFVSHQMTAVSRLCNQAMFLEKGRLTAYGHKDEIIDLYLSSGAGVVGPGAWVDLSSAEREGNGQARFVAARCSGRAETAGGQPYPDGPLEVGLVIESESPREVASLAVTVYDRFGMKLVNADTIAQGNIVALRRGRNELMVRINSLHLNPGQYTVGLWLANSPLVYDHVPSALQFEVVDAGTSGLGREPEDHGMVTGGFEVVGEAVHGLTNTVSGVTVD